MPQDPFRRLIEDAPVEGKVVSERTFVPDSHTVPEADLFTGDRFLICDQADWVEIYNLGPFNEEPGLPPVYEWHALFSRRVIIEPPAGFKCSVQGKCWGEEIVAYRCNADGVVTNWEERLELRANSYQTAARKLRFLLLNDLIQYVPVPIED